ncbi:hypothetical protein MRX96_033578 [Rhipicephalus microplus]
MNADEFPALMRASDTDEIHGLAALCPARLLKSSDAAGKPPQHAIPAKASAQTTAPKGLLVCTEKRRAWPPRLRRAAAPCARSLGGHAQASA